MHNSLLNMKKKESHTIYTNIHSRVDPYKENNTANSWFA